MPPRRWVNTDTVFMSYSYASRCTCRKPTKAVGAVWRYCRGDKERGQKTYLWYYASVFFKLDDNGEWHIYYSNMPYNPPSLRQIIEKTEADGENVQCYHCQGTIPIRILYPREFGLMDEDVRR